jgi:hypothetical protein
MLLDSKSKKELETMLDFLVRLDRVSDQRHTKEISNVVYSLQRLVKKIAEESQLMEKLHTFKVLPININALVGAPYRNYDSMLMQLKALLPQLAELKGIHLAYLNSQGKIAKEHKKQLEELMKDPKNYDQIKSLWKKITTKE